MRPIERPFERDGLPLFGVPAALTATYGGDFWLSRPELCANFVSSVDGVVALTGGGESRRIVSGGNEADRFIMGLLRATADAVLIGAGTFRKADGDWWYPETVHPAARERPSPVHEHRGSAPRSHANCLLSEQALALADPV